MAESLTGKWAYSTDGEVYHSAHNTKEEAIAEGSWYDGTYYVGQCIAPTPPEDLFTEYDVENWIDGSVLCHEDYSGDWADGALQSSRAQRQELADMVSAIIGWWIDKHGLRPTHYNIDPISVEKLEKVKE